MPEESIEIYMLRNIQAEQKKTNERLETLDGRVLNSAKKLGKSKERYPRLPLLKNHGGCPQSLGQSLRQCCLQQAGPSSTCASECRE